MTDRPILVFDSGVGGLSVATEIRRLLPALSQHYLMDSAGFPYGIKDDASLTARVLEVCTQAVATHQPRLLVVACNTASTLALPALREALDIPVVGVVPALKVAANACPGGEIGLLATAATINRSYTDNLIRDFAGGCKVRRLGSTELVQWAEDWLAYGREPEGLFEHLNSWLTQPYPVGQVVLGCTHFPLLRGMLETLWPQVTWVDSGAAVARRVAQLLAEQADADSASNREGGTGHDGRPPLQLFWTGTKTPAAGVLAYAAEL